MTRGRLAVITFGLLAGLFVAALVLPIGGAGGVMTLGVVVALVGVWFFRFHPDGDLWASASEAGVNPWWIVLLVLLAAVALLVLRVGLLEAS